MSHRLWRTGALLLTLSVIGGGVLGHSPSGHAQAADLGTIGNLVWSDTNGDGIQSPGEPGLGGVRVIVRSLGGGPLGSDVSDSVGAYRITNLPPDIVVVTVDAATLPRGASLSPPSQTKWTDDSDLDPVTGTARAYADPDGNDNIDVGVVGVVAPSTTAPTTTSPTTTSPTTTAPATTTPTTSAPTTTRGSTTTIGDAGFAAGPGVVTGVAWNDTNANGRRDAGESGVADVIVGFHKVLTAGWDYQAATRTDSSGRYRIDGLEAASYAVVFDPGLSWRYAPTDVGTDDADSDVNALGFTIARLTAAQGGVVDAGLIAIAPPATLPPTSLPPTTVPPTTRPTSTTLAPTTLAPPTTRPTTVPPTTTAPTSCAPVRIMPLGDSISAGQESYRGPLYRWLVSNGRNVDFVGGESWAPTGGGDADHEGHGGYTIGPDSNIDWRGEPGNLAQHIDSWIPQARPDVILLSIGSNDLAGGPIVAGAAPSRLRNLVARLQQLAPNATIVLSDMLPNRWSPNSSPEIDALNAAIRDLGTTSSTDRVVWGNTLAGVRSLGFDLNADLVDQVHVSVSGGEKWAQAWRPTVVAATDATGCHSS